MSVYNTKIITSNNIKSFIGEKIQKQLGNRGWTNKTIGNTIENPHELRETVDVRWNIDGSRNNDPATAYTNKDGSYIVRNNNTGDVVQVSDRNNPNWKSPFKDKD